VIIRVPATSANLGPGFDTLGCALAWHAEFRLAAGGSGRPPVDDRHIAWRAFRHGGGTGPLWVTSPLPMGRGVGSSAAMRVGGLAAAAVQRHGAGVDLRDPSLGLLAAASELEGHADNAAAALFGGVVVTAAGEVVALPAVPDLVVIVWIPPQVSRTRASRKALPPAVPFADAAFNVSRVALLVAGLATGRLDVLRLGTQDRLHQDARLEAYPGTRQALEAALDAGALAAWLSGSGPSMACWCRPGETDGVVDALPAQGRTLVLDIDRSGTVVDLHD